MDKRAAAFFPAAVVWLGTGALIGALMAIWPARWLYLRPAHVTINLFGWMSMLVFAMTYQVIPVFIRRQLHRPGLVALHAAVANAAVLAAFAGQLWQAPALVAAGWVGLAVSGALFLANIIGAARRGAPVPDADQRARRITHGALDLAALRPLDRTARAFTEASVLYLIAGAGWTAAAHLAGVRGEAAAAFLIRYGWLAMVVFGTSYHLLPRLTGRLPAGIGTLRWQLLGVNLGVIAAAAGTAGRWPALTRTGVALLALTSLAYVACMAGPVLRPRPAAGDGGPALRGMPRAFATGSWASLALAGLTGLAWAAGGNAVPYDWFLGQTHLYLLGWMTMLAYAVAAVVLPRFLGRAGGPGWLYGLQLALALPGITLVAAAFLLRSLTPGLPWGGLFGAGATLCATAALVFGAYLFATLAHSYQVFTRSGIRA